MRAHKKIIHTFALLISFLFLTAQGSISFAQEEDLTYTISVKPVNNQIDKSSTYYDLLVSPNDKQTLTVIVSNTGDKDKKISVTPTNAITNQNGVIDYSPQSKEYKYDSGLKAPFVSMIGEKKEVDLKPGESKEVPFELNVPETPFTGTVLGGFVAEIVDEKDDTTKQDSGVKIVNKFQLVKAVMLRENQDAISPELTLNDVKPALVSYRTAVTANLQNTEPTMFGKMKVDAKITKKGETEVLKSSTKENLEMAPNSNFDFPIMWGNQRLEPGEYTLTLVATSGEKKWEFAKNFTISSEESEKINKEAVDIEDANAFNWWYIIIAVILLLVLILVIVYLIYRKKKKKKEQELKRKKIQAKKKRKKIAESKRNRMNKEN